jgi:hypothetical protein
VRPLAPAQVFTLHDAVAAGWTPSALAHAVRVGRIVRVRRGVYADVSADPLISRIRAATVAYPGAVVSHRAAVLLHGLPLVCAPPPMPEVTVAPGANANLAGVHVHRASVRPEDVVDVGGTRALSIARTLCDVARHHRIGVAVSAADAALNSHRTDRTSIEDVLDFCASWPGAARARRALAATDRLAESPLESLSRLAIARLGLPAPEPQVAIMDAHGRFVGRCDFYWDEFGVVGEADGRSKYDGRQVLTAEKERQEAFEDLGLVVVRWGWTHATRDTPVLCTKLETGFERGRRRDRSGFPRLWTPRSTGERR